MARVHTSILVATLAVGCHENIALAPPPVIEGGSVFMLARDQDRPEVYASDVPQLPHLAFRSLELRALVYPCPSLAYLVIPGAVRVISEPSILPRMPAPEQMYLASISEDLQVEWTQIAVLDEPFATDFRSLDLPEDNACRPHAPPFEILTAELAQADYSAPTFAVTLEDGSVLIGTRAGIYVATIFDDRVELEEAGLSVSTPSDAAFVQDDGEVWLWGRDGRLARGRLETGFAIQPVRTATSARLYPAIVGSTGDAPFELFVMTGNGVLGRFAGDGWSELHTGAIPQNRRCGTVGSGMVLPKVAWIGPGHVVAIGASDYENKIIRYRNGVVSEENVPTLGGDDWPTSVGYFPGLGTVVGTCRGFILVDRGEGFVLSPDKPALGSVRSFARFGPSLIYTSGTQRPNFVRFHPAAGYCGAETAPLTNYLATLPDRKSVLMAHECDEEPCGVHVSVLRLEEDPSECLLDQLE